jgi:hypothetical protein
MSDRLRAEMGELKTPTSVVLMGLQPLAAVIKA